MKKIIYLILGIILSLNVLAEIPYSELPAGQSATGISTCFISSADGIKLVNYTIDDGNQYFFYPKEEFKDAANRFFLQTCFGSWSVNYNFGKVTYHEKAIGNSNWY